MDSYILGVLWSIGRYEAGNGDNYFFVRSRSRYHLEVLRTYFECSNKIFPLLRKGEIQWCLKLHVKLHRFPIQKLMELGWAERNEEERRYPIQVENHSDFLRSYLELHSQFDWQTSYRGKKNKDRKYYRTRLRIYGNAKLIEQVNEILYVEIGISKHSPQFSPNGKTTYIQLTALGEIKKILEYIDGSPKSPEWWGQAEEYLAQPRKEG